VRETHALRVGIDAYDLMIGRYSAPLAVAFADLAGVAPPQRVLDVGCGPGALTSELVRRVGADHVAAIEPSRAFVEECRRRNPGADVRVAPAEELPFADATFDGALAQLTFNFFSDGDAAAAELRRVLVPGGIAAGCVWDVAGGRVVQELGTASGLYPPFSPDGNWLDEFTSELATFPSGTHDDQVDTLSYAVRVQVADWTPARDDPRPGLSPHERAVVAAASAATGDGHGDLDIMNVPF